MTSSFFYLARFCHFLLDLAEIWFVDILVYAELDSKKIFTWWRHSRRWRHHFFYLARFCHFLLDLAEIWFVDILVYAELDSKKFLRDDVILVDDVIVSST